MPTLMQIYSNHQTNKLVTRTVEYTVKQFYLMHRKPFILQMFGSVSAILDTDDDSQFGDAHKVKNKNLKITHFLTFLNQVQPNCLFNLLLSLETPSPDPLNIGELVREEKPLKAIDFCYHDENEMVTVFDCISLCVMVVAYSADSVRGQQMLVKFKQSAQNLSKIKVFGFRLFWRQFYRATFSKFSCQRTSTMGSLKRTFSCSLRWRSEP
jgi:protein unc-80